jgi:hypothetical protein
LDALEQFRTQIFLLENAIQTEDWVTLEAVLKQARSQHQALINSDFTDGKEIS